MTSKIFKMKILFQNSKNKQFTTLEIDPQATVESVRDELKGKHNFPDGAYSFIYKGKILRNPGPFSSLEENAKVIVYVKAEEPKPPENIPEEQANPFQQRPQIQTQQQRQQALQRNEQQVLDRIRLILTSAMETNLVEKVYQPENNFYDHPKEVYEISQMLDETNSALISEFLARHFEITLRLFDIPADRILALIGNNLSMIYRVLNDFDATFMELSDEQRKAFDRLKQLNYDLKITLDTFIACEFNEERTRECLEQIGK